MSFLDGDLDSSICFKRPLTHTADKGDPLGAEKLYSAFLATTNPSWNSTAKKCSGYFEAIFSRF
jgi:hypothetical protein